MTPTRRLAVTAASLALAFAAAACGSSTASTTPASAAASPAAESVAPAESEATESQAAESAEPSEAGGPAVSFVAGAAADLEAKLPSDANGIAFSKASFDGASLGAAGVPLDSSQLDPILKATGKSVQDLAVAIATPKDTSSGATTMMMALQLRGVPAEQLLPLLDSTGQTGGLKDATIGGKSVKTGGQSPFTVTMYMKDDVLYYILFADTATAESIVSQLP